MRAIWNLNQYILLESLVIGLIKESNMGKVLQRIERRKYIWHRIIPKIAIFVSICSLLVILAFAFNFHGFRDSFQNWYEIVFFFWLIFLAPSLPSTCYEWYELIKDSLVETHELNQEASMSENEVYLFHTPKALTYPKKLLRLLRGDY